MTEVDRARVLEVLRESRAAGFLGPAPAEQQLAHALAFAGAVDPPSQAVDLGAGGGLPGLALAALAWPQAAWTLLDANLRRCQFLEGAVAELGLGARVEVRHGRAEDVARDPHLRHACDLVVARSFGPPPVVAECGAPLLRVGGALVVSEPPAERTVDRWPAEPLATLGLGPAEPVDGPFHLVRLPCLVLAGDRWPRRTGVPAKRPLYPVPGGRGAADA